MIILFVAALLFLPSPSSADFINNLRPHSIDSLKLKCDALPFRSTYVENRCLFAVFGNVSYKDTSALCASKFSGAQVALNTRGIHQVIMADASQFHDDANSTDAKHTICVVEGGYKCEQGYALVRRKCAFPAKKKMNFVDARKYCKKLGLELPSSENDLENQILADELIDKEPVWVQKTLEKKANSFEWTLGNNYSRFTTCNGASKKPRTYAGSQSTGCNDPFASIVEKTGYWSNTDQKNYAPAIVKYLLEVISVDGPCAPLHELNEDSGRCEWTGPADACAQLINTWNHTYFISMKEWFPDFVHAEECFATTKNAHWDGMCNLQIVATAVVVRRGCMFTGYAHPISGTAWQEVKLVEDLLYGYHTVPNYVTRDPVRTVTSWGGGLTRANCFCDPTEATINGHVPSPPPDKKCIEHHKFNETMQQCEWTKDPKFCAEISTHENLKMMLEIPNWPINRKYDVEHVSTLKHLSPNFDYRHKTLPTAGYGKYTIAFSVNGLGNPGIYQGTARFTCECIR